MKESFVENYLRTTVEKQGALCEKTITLGRKGRPDREITWPWGGMDLVETKRPKGARFEPGQKPDHRERAKRGVPVYIIDTPEKVDRYVAARLERKHLPELWSVPLLASQYAAPPTKKCGECDDGTWFDASHGCSRTCRACNGTGEKAA